MHHIEAAIRFHNESLNNPEQANKHLLKDFFGEDMANVYQLYLNEVEQARQGNEMVSGVVLITKLNEKYKVILNALEDASVLAGECYRIANHAMDVVRDSLMHMKHCSSIYITPDDQIVSYGKEQLAEDATTEQVLKFVEQVINDPTIEVKLFPSSENEESDIDLIYVYGKYVSMVIQSFGDTQQPDFTFYLQAIEGKNPIGIEVDSEFASDLGFNLGYLLQKHKPVLYVEQNQFGYK